MAKTKVKKDGGLSQRALLVTMQISQWSGRKIDKKANTTVETTHNTSALAGNYSKKLLPGSVELAEVTSVVSQIRSYFHEQTLPWMSDGSRIISSQNYLEFVTKMRKLKGDFDSAVKAFGAAYPKLKADAASKLGNLYSVDEYPEDIEEKFDVEINYLPLPDVKDFRTEISETEKKEFVRKMKEVEQATVKDCFDRLHNVVKSAAEKLAQPDAVFRDSLVENLQSMVDLLPKLNIAEDKELEKTRKEVAKVIGSVTPDLLRENQLERDKASKALADIDSRISVFMGAKK